MRKFFSYLFIIVFLLVPINSASAQDQQPPNPVYVVQSGDTLSSIALRFGITVNDLIDSNQLANPNALAAGMELKIPGLEGISGKLITEAIPFGQNLTNLSHYYSIPISLLIKLNRITSPVEVYAGSNLIIPQNEQRSYLKSISALGSGETSLELAAQNNANPWELSLIDQLDHPSSVLPGQISFVPTDQDTPLPNPLSPLVASLTLTPLPLVQGATVVVRAKTTQPAALTGTLAGKPLNFFEIAPQEYVALQGIHAMSTPGLSDFSLQVKTDHSTVGFDQMMLLQQGFFAKDPPLSVDPATIDPAITKPEDDLIRKMITPVTPTKQWQGQFLDPMDKPICIKSWYGNRRSYNGGDYSYFHTGLDFGVCANLNIYAVAAGTVVYTGLLTVRGNTTIIDHGWGIYTCYYHQKEIQVKVGDHVEAGQDIGEVGATGRVTGPHLHLDVWVNGIQVNPQDWLDAPFPG